MDAETRDKLRPILLRSKLGEFVSEDEQAFARQCWRQWPKEYSALQTAEVHPRAAKRIALTQQRKRHKAPQPEASRTRTRRPSTGRIKPDDN